METDTDERALLAAIVEHPDEDTQRLAYADYLDEVAGRETPRAELIRVQVELAAIEASQGGEKFWASMRGVHARPKCPGCSPWCRLFQREQALLAAHEGEWRKAGACLECEGTGLIQHNPPLELPTSDRRKVYSSGCNWCGDGRSAGTGDAGGLLCEFFYPLTPQGVRGTGSRERVRLTWRRGFPDLVTVPALGDVLEERNGVTWTSWDEHGADFVREWQPTLWARAVVAHHPVRGFVPLDRGPEASHQHRGWFRYFEGDGPNDLPSCVFGALKGEYPEDQYGVARVPYWRAREAAVDALAVALGAVVRGEAKGV